MISYVTVGADDIARAKTVFTLRSCQLLITGWRRVLRA